MLYLRSVVNAGVRNTERYDCDSLSALSYNSNSVSIPCRMNADMGTCVLFDNERRRSICSSLRFTQIAFMGYIIAYMRICCQLFFEVLFSNSLTPISPFASLVSNL